MGTETDGGRLSAMCGGRGLELPSRAVGRLYGVYHSTVPQLRVPRKARLQKRAVPSLAAKAGTTAPQPRPLAVKPNICTSLTCHIYPLVYCHQFSWFLPPSGPLAHMLSICYFPAPALDRQIPTVIAASIREEASRNQCLMASSPHQMPPHR